MTRIILSSSLCFLFIIIVAVPSTQAALFDRGSFSDGIGGTMNLIYDDDRNITWLGDANFGAGSAFDNGPVSTDGQMTWNNAIAWADSLTVGGFTDWRLPITLQPDATCSVQSPASSEFNCTGSEMGHLFYEELSGTASSSILTSGDPDLALFNNLQAFAYWSSTEGTSGPLTTAWVFGFATGRQSQIGQNSHFLAWAVRDGDVAPVPTPSALLLMGTGLAGFLTFRRWQIRIGRA